MNKIARASVILMIGTILSKILGFARELMVAYRFGAGSVSDAFVLTNSIPTLIFVPIAAAININFIPYYHKIEGDSDRNDFTSNMTNVCVIILLVGCIIIYALPRCILKVFATGLPEETEQYAVLMLRIVVFSIIPIMISYLYQAYLQANDYFLSTALCGVFTNIVVIGFTFVASIEIYYILSIWTVVSHVVGLIPIFYCIKKMTSFQYSLCIQFNDQRIKDIAFLTLPLLAESIASSMSLIVDRNLASFLDKGTISGLGYAGTIGNIASSVIATAIITATFPLFSKILASGNREKFAQQFKNYAVVICYLLGPISVFMVINARDIVTCVFEHGAFGVEATKIVSESLKCYSVGVLPMGLQTYILRGFYAVQDVKTPVKIKVFALLCNIVLNILSVRWLKHIGIALSTSVAYVIAYVLLTNCISEKHGINHMRTITVEGLLALLVSTIPAISLFLFFNNVLFIHNCNIKLLLEGLLFLGGYIVMMRLFRKNIFNDIIRFIKQ